jgi:hypothetical protein
VNTEALQVGSIGYLADGSIVRMLAKNSDNRFVVEVGRRNEDDEDGEVFFDGVKTVSHLYPQPPVVAVEARIAELVLQECALRERISELREKQIEETKAIDRLKSFDCLKCIDAFLQGKITHYVIWDRNYNGVDYDFRISTPEAEKCGDEARSSDLKMLGLYGKQDCFKKGVNPDAEWRLTYYRDGSGASYKQVKPCLSLEQAKEVAAAMLGKSLAHYANNESAGRWPLEGLEKSCESCFLEVPEWLSERLKQIHRASLQEAVDKQRKELQAAQSKLDTLLSTY